MFVSFIVIYSAVAIFTFAQVAELKCDSFSEFCDQKYSDVSFVGATSSPL